MLTLTAHPPAHTDHDLSLLDRTTGTLWLSDLLFVERIPSLDGSLPGWRRVLDRLRDAPAAAASRAVPGHGPAAVPWPAAAGPLLRYLEALEEAARAAIAAGVGLAEAPARVAAAGDLARYLEALRDGTRAAIAAGVGIAEAPDRVALAEARPWALAGAYHGRNVTAAYRELEWE